MEDLPIWINRKVREYSEPSRAGIPRGDTLPIPRPKFHASLSMLTYDSPACPELQQVADLVGRNYGLIAKWRNEDRFWQAASSGAEQFLNEWLPIFVSTSEQCASAKGNAREHLRKRLAHMIRRARASWGSFLVYRLIEEYEQILRDRTLTAETLRNLFQLLVSVSSPSMSKKLLARDVERISKRIAVRVKELTLEASEAGRKQDASALIELLAEMATAGIVLQAGLAAAPRNGR